MSGRRVAGGHVGDVVVGDVRGADPARERRSVDDHVADPGPGLFVGGDAMRRRTSVE